MAEVLQKETHETVRSRGWTAGRVIKWILVLGVLAGVGYAGYSIWQQLSREESTDDAQIDGTLTPISSRVAGHVIAVHVEDDQPVKAGDVLVELDQQDFGVALAKAQADLADAEATVEGARNDVPVASANSAGALGGARAQADDASTTVGMAEQQLGAARSRLGVAQANVKVAQANQNKASQDLERYRILVAKDEISKQMYDQAAAALTSAAATVEAQQAAVTEAQQNAATAQQAVEQAKARLAGAQAVVHAAESGPQQVKSTEARLQAALAKVAQNRALVEQAKLNLGYTTIIAPCDGVVGRKAVEPGQNIQAGQQLMAVVSLGDIWVTANFKETQLKDMRVGQKVKISVDATGRDYTGKVERIAGASGAKFSLLPPENATGNYVRVVQRIPVRISIDPGQDRDHQLRTGMSATPKVLVR